VSTATRETKAEARRNNGLEQITDKTITKKQHEIAHIFVGRSWFHISRSVRWQK